jgi:hypothetical protein
MIKFGDTDHQYRQFYTSKQYQLVYLEINKLSSKGRFVKFSFSYYLECFVESKQWLTCYSSKKIFVLQGGLFCLCEIVLHVDVY